MDKVEAAKCVAHLDEDECHDLLMYLAEVFEHKVISKSGEDVTYYLATDYSEMQKSYGLEND